MGLGVELPKTESCKMLMQIHEVMFTEEFPLDSAQFLSVFV